MRDKIPYQDIVVTTPISLSSVRASDCGTIQLISKVLTGMLKDANLTKQDIDGLSVASFTLKPDSVVSLTDHFGMELQWLEQLPMGGASGVIALKRAARSIQAGDVDIVACIAADTTTKASFTDLIANFSSFTTDAVFPYGAAGPNSIFAMITQAYMEHFEVGREDFGRLCIMQRENASHYPNALFRTPLTIEDYLNARPIAEPLGLYDCVPLCAGGEGFMVMSEERAIDLDLSYARILSVTEQYNSHRLDALHFRGGWDTFREELYQDAGVSSEEISFAELYDDYPVMVFIQLEDLGFCEKGMAKEFCQQHDLRNHGDFPVNTNGGQLSAGQAGAAGGYLSITEAVRQLTGTATSMQIPQAQLGLVSGYGIVNYDRGLCCSAAILEGTSK